MMLLLLLDSWRLSAVLARHAAPRHAAAMLLPPLPMLMPCRLRHAFFLFADDAASAS